MKIRIQSTAGEINHTVLHDLSCICLALGKSQLGGDRNKIIDKTGSHLISSSMSSIVLMKTRTICLSA